jgi:hypothetical protein
VNPLIDEFNARIESSREEHRQRWHNGTNRAEFMKSFASQRWSHVQGHVVEVFGLPGTAEVTVVDVANSGGRVELNGMLIGGDLPGIRMQDIIDVPIFGPGEVWRFLDDGSDQGEAWREAVFPGFSWQEGPGLFGYGSAGGYATSISYGDDPEKKWITTYFRKPFLREGGGLFDSLHLSMSVAGGAVFYVNGTEVLRHRMPAGAINHTTLALGGPDPSSVSGLHAWFAADRDLNTRAVGEDRFVTEWRDLSGQRRHAAQTSSSRQPRWIESAIAGNPALRFDGSDDFMEAPIGDLRNGMTLFMVARVHASGGAYDSYLGLSGAGLGNVLYHVGSGGGRGLGITQPNQNLSNNTQPSDQFELIRIEADGAYNQRMTRVASGESVVTRLTRTDGIVSSLTLGASRNGSNGIADFLPVDIAEVVLFERELDEAETAEVEAYLAGKYSFEQAPAFTRDAGNPRLWLAADGAMNTRTTFGGDVRVTRWRDLSGNESDAVQGNNSLQPTLIEEAVHGRPALRFNGSNQFMEGPIGDYRAGMSLFLVARVHADGGPYDSYLGLNGAGLGNVLYHVGSGGGRGLAITQPNQNLSSNPARSEQFELIRIEAGTNFIHRMIRAASGEVVSSQLTHPWGTVTNFTLGASKHSGDGITDHLPVDIAEVILYDRELNVFERHAVEAYLATKYGFSLPPHWFTYRIPADHLVDGENVLAVETHLASPSAEHFHFDARLSGEFERNVAAWTGTYFQGVPVTVQAIPEPGYRFAGWLGRDETHSLLTLTLSEAVTLMPIFEVDEGGLEDLVPPPHRLSSGPYSFTAWEPDSPAGTYPAHMIFEQTSQGDPGLEIEMNGFWALPYNLTSRSRVNGLGYDGISFINTGNAQEAPDAGFLGSAILALDTRGKERIAVTWSAGTVLPNERTYGLRLQYRLSDSGAFTDVLDANSQPVEYLRHELAGHGRIIGPVILPPETENRPYVQLRWKYYYLAGSSGPRAQLRLDDILVTSGDPGGDEGEAVFLPEGTADWTYALNWTTSAYPDGPGMTARVGPARAGDRDVNLRAPVTVGNLIIENEDSPHRNRLRDRDLGNTLTFQSEDGPARLSVSATGMGFVEVGVEAGTILHSDLIVDMNYLPDFVPYGGLRFRENWSGPGGLIKRGEGILSLTGGGKDYLGPTIIDFGVLSLTAPAAPPQTSGVSVNPGGQLRLVSSSEGSGPRIHTFGGDLMLNSEGRGGGIPEGEGEGVLGALRYEPGGTGNWAVVTNDLVINGNSGLHVSGLGNVLELKGNLSGGGSIWKSGGGRLLLSGDSAGYDRPMTVGTGILRVDGQLGADVFLESETILQGSGWLANVAGLGTVLLDQEILTAESVNGLHYQFVFSRTGSPEYDHASSSGNGLLHLTGEIPFIHPLNAMNRIDVFIDTPAIANGDIFRGGFFAQHGGNLGGALSGAAIRIFAADPEGTFELNGRTYRLYTGPWTVAVNGVPEQAVFASGTVMGAVMEFRFGSDLHDSYASWVERTFLHGDREDPAISGPAADPRGEGITNLLRYALEIDPYQPGREFLPQHGMESSRLFLQFHRDPSKSDIAYVVEASSNLVDWQEVLYDSRTSAVENSHGDAMRILDSRTLHDVEGRRFLRLRIERLD